MRRRRKALVRRETEMWFEVEGFKVGAEVVGEVGAGQGELDGCFQVAELVAGVVAPALELDAVNGAARSQHPEGVGQLDLAAGVGAGSGQDLKDLGW